MQDWELLGQNKHGNLRVGMLIRENSGNIKYFQMLGNDVPMGSLSTCFISFSIVMNPVGSSMPVICKTTNSAIDEHRKSRSTEARIS
jgi:hypothetical protein